MRIKPAYLRCWLICFRLKHPLTAAFFLCCTIISCSNYTAPQIPNTAPDQWAHQLSPTPNSPQPDLQLWWKVFDDAQLNQLIEEALTANLNLEQACERIKRARALLGHAGDEFLPELHMHSRTIESIDALDTYFQYGLDASWELGLFGRHESTNKIAQASADITIANAQAIQVSVIAEIARTYIELRSSQQQIILFENLRKLQQAQIDFLTLRNKLHISTTQEIVAIETEITKTNIALLKCQQFADESAQRIALLLGKMAPDKNWLETGAQPTFEDVSLATLPVDVLRIRPEIKTAEAEVFHAAGELGIAKAELYPRVSLGSAFLYSANVTQNTDLDAAIHSTPGIGPTIDIPLFDWGRRRAAVTAQNSVLNEALLAYRQAVLEAINETEIALSTLQMQQKLLIHAQGNLTRQQKNFVREQKLLQSGLSNQLVTFDAKQAELHAALYLIEAHAGHDLALIALYKSLGGAPLIATSDSVTRTNSTDNKE